MMYKQTSSLFLLGVSYNKSFQYTFSIRLHLSIFFILCSLIPCFSHAVGYLSLTDKPLFYTKPALSNQTDNIMLLMDDSGSMIQENASIIHWGVDAYLDGSKGIFSPIWQAYTLMNCSDPQQLYEMRGYGRMMYGPLEKNLSDNQAHIRNSLDGPAISQQVDQVSISTHVIDDNDDDDIEDEDRYEQYEPLANLSGNHIGNSTPIEVSTNCKTVVPTQYRPSVFRVDWRGFSSQLNQLFYNPAIDYKPWIGFPEAQFNSALYDPRLTDAIDLGNDLFGGLGFIYVTAIDDKGFQGDRPTPQGMTNQSNGLIDLWDSHIQYSVSSNQIVVEYITYSPGFVGLSCSPRAAAEDPPYASCFNARVIERQVITGGQTIHGRTLVEEQQNIANWFTYHRNRMSAVRSVVAHFSHAADVNTGFTTIHDWETNFIEIPQDSYDPIVHTKQILSSLYQDSTHGGTPTRSALEAVGNYFKGDLSGKSSPIVHACQRNMAVVISDGWWTDSGNGYNETITVGNVDGDPYSSTLADISHHYFTQDLSPLPNILIPNALNPNTFQHMVTSIIGLGVSASLTDSDGDLWPDPVLKESDTWGGDPFSKNRDDRLDARVNDAWHAAYNGRGVYIESSNPEQLMRGLQKAVDNQSLPDVGYSTHIATNSQRLQTGTLLYQSAFYPATWSGQLSAIELDENNGNILKEAWNVQAVFESSSRQREIISFNPESKRGIVFEWPQGGMLQLSPSTFSKRQVGQLLKGNQAGVPDDYGKDVIEYLRAGTPLTPKNKVYSIRKYKQLLGDVLHSDPVIVGKPNRGYLFPWPQHAPENQDTYIDFMQKHKNRTPVLYVGSNDGMLHAFNADSAVKGGGTELFAYVPAIVYPKLAELASPHYRHTSYVDGKIVVEDVYFKGVGKHKKGWHTVLLGSVRKGGQGFYALDVTDPSKFSEHNAEDMVLWEITDRDDIDIGYTYGTPTIGRLPNGQWVALVSGGYNHTVPDHSTSQTGHAFLFVIDLETGAFTKIDTGMGPAQDPLNLNRPNGLGSPTLVDSDRNFISERAYAGDLFGNFWKFDFSGVTQTPLNKNQVKVKKLFVAQSKQGDPQSITVQPDVGTHPTGTGVLIYFGTGKYIEIADTNPNLQTTNSVYALWDDDSDFLIKRNELLEQSILAELALTQAQDWDQDGQPDQINVRLHSDNPIYWSGNSAHKGWFFDLVSPIDQNNRGERVIVRPLIRNDRLILTTIMPAQIDCATGVQTWTLELSRFHGGPLSQAVMDINGDGMVNHQDFLHHNGVERVPTGIQAHNTRPSLPTILTDGNDTEYKFIGLSDGRIKKVNGVSSVISKRVQWLQLE